MTNPTPTLATATTHIVMTASAKMPRSCWGRYARVAVVRVDVIDGEPVEPKMISERAIGVAEVVQTWERLSVGTTSACAYQRAIVEAQDMAAALNA